jgi:arylsulfatase A-like enzyme
MRIIRRSGAFATSFRPARAGLDAALGRGYGGGAFDPGPRKGAAMRAVLVLYDSLNRHLLPPYGCDWVHAPNFRRLAERAATFDTAYIGSAPTIPMRRELHTGRYNFLHRCWGPIEPFDDSMPELLKQHGVHTHLVSDGYHYWEDGGATYHNRYSTWHFNRGQEGDFWKADLNDPDVPEPNPGRGPSSHQDWINRAYMPNEEDWPQARTFAGGVEFLQTNHAHDNWLLQIETFDPHEPYFVPQRFKNLYEHDFGKFQDDWPPYRPLEPTDAEMTEHYRFLNAALISFCDHSLGTVLDAFDELGLWDDTMLMVTTDHGFLLGEHGWWSKCVMPFYDEVARVPLFLWDPRSGVRGERRASLVQAIDLAPTLLESFGAERTADMQGVPLAETVASDAGVREAGIFGIHGGHVNVTDGRYVYMHPPAAPENGPVFNYTLMPTNMRGYFDLERLAEAELHPGFPFTKGARLLKVPAASRWGGRTHEFGSALFDTESDPKQEHSMDDKAVRDRMLRHLVRLLKESDAPPEQYERLGLSAD